MGNQSEGSIRSGRGRGGGEGSYNSLDRVVPRREEAEQTWTLQGEVGRGDWLLIRTSGNRAKSPAKKSNTAGKPSAPGIQRKAPTSNTNSKNHLYTQGRFHLNQRLLVETIVH